MKKISIISLVLVIAVGSYAATVESQNVVGFFRINIETNWNLIAVPMQKLAVAQGQLGMLHSGSTLIVDSPSWDVGEYEWGRDTEGNGDDFQEPGLSYFYVEITGPAGSPFAGRYAYITNSTALGLTIIDGDDLIAGCSNETFKIVPAYRIRDIFGEPGSSKLHGTTSASTADNVWTFNPGGGYNNLLYYNSGGGYIQEGVPGLANDYVIDRDEGMFVNRRAGPTNIVVTGEVSPHPQKIVLVEGWQMIGGQAVVDKTLAELGLSSVVDGATSASAADNIWAFNSGGGYQNVIYYNSGGGWIQEGVPGLSDDYVLNAGSGYFINVRSNDTQWTRDSPLQ